MQTVTNAIVKEVIVHSDTLREFVIVPDKYRKYQPGVFLQLSLDNATASECWPESRTFSIANNYNRNTKEMKLIINKIGRYTQKIFDNLVVGATCTIKYSFGDMLLPESEDDNDIICIAGGSGISPFLSFMECLHSNDDISRLKIFYSAKYRNELLQKDYISNLLGDSFYPYVTREQIKDCKNERISISDLPIDCKNHYYICGNPDFIDYFKNGLSELGISKIYTDEWE